MIAKAEGLLLGCICVCGVCCWGIFGRGIVLLMPRSVFSRFVVSRGASWSVYRLPAAAGSVVAGVRAWGVYAPA